MKETIEITYSVLGNEEAGETTFELEVSDHIYNLLEENEDEGNFLDSDFISEELPSIHQKILRGIRNNMKEEGFDPKDGIITTRQPWGAIKETYSLDASQEFLYDNADDDEIEYSVLLY